MDKRKKQIKLAFIIVFLLLSLIPAIGIFTPAKESQEKRELAQRPELKLDSSIFDFPAQFEAFFKDNFLFRSELVTYNSEINLSIFDSADPNADAIVGKEGWLFYSGGMAIEYNQAENPFSDGQLDSWTSFFNSRAQALENREIPYYFFVAPNKHSVYPEFLPDYADQVGEQTRYDQLQETLGTKDYFIDMREHLLEEKEQYQVYRKYDTHWNDLGTITAYLRIIDAIKQDYPEIDVVATDELNREFMQVENGDLKNMLSLKDKIFENDYVYDFSELPKSMEPVKVGDKQVYVYDSNRDDLPTLLVFGDSFFEHGLLDLLAVSFDKVIWYREPSDFTNITEDLINEYEPDLVLQEFVERKLQRDGVPTIDSISTN